MTKHEISLLRNFSEYEKDVYGRHIFEKAYEIDPVLMERVDKMVDFAKQEYGTVRGQFVVHDINLGDHSTGSLHYKGMAIDGHFKDVNLSISAMLLMKYGFKGVGLYPQWNNKGFHADIRNTDTVTTWVHYDSDYQYEWQFFEEQLEIEMEC